MLTQKSIFSNSRLGVNCLNSLKKGALPPIIDLFYYLNCEAMRSKTGTGTSSPSLIISYCFITDS